MTIYNEKAVNKPTENYHPVLQFPSALCRISILQLIVLVSQPATLTFGLTLTALINFVSAADSCFQ